MLSSHHYILFSVLTEVYPLICRFAQKTELQHPVYTVQSQVMSHLCSYSTVWMKFGFVICPSCDSSQPECPPPRLNSSSSLLCIFSCPSLTPAPHLPLAPVRLVRGCHRTSCDKQANTYKHAAECARTRARTHTHQQMREHANDKQQHIHSSFSLPLTFMWAKLNEQ